MSYEGKRRKKQKKRETWQESAAVKIPGDKKISEMLCIMEGNIADRKLLGKEGIDTIVNAANPTLMGSSRGVDGAVHAAIYQLSGRRYQFRDKIREELGVLGEEKQILCRRGQAVLTSGYKLCSHVIHVVGAKYDGNGEKSTCSGSRVRLLESCYSQIVELVKQYPDIKRIAIPIIGAGEYRFPYELAMRVALAGIANALMEWKGQDPELFEMAGIERIYFFIYDSDEKTRKEHMECAKAVYRKFETCIGKERRIVYQKSMEAHCRYINEIRRYDEQRGYFSVAKDIRLLLMYFRLLFLPSMWCKDLLGGCDWEKRRNFVERLTLIKAVLPIFYYGIFSAAAGKGWEKYLEIIFSALVVYAMCDTISYLMTLIVMADIQRPSANIIRSILLLFVNYMEVSLDMAWLYWAACRGQITVGKALLFGILGERQTVAGSDIWAYMDAGIRFFFLSLVFGYLANHMRQRKFRS